MPFNPLTGQWERIQPLWTGGSTWDQPTYGDDPDWAAETMPAGPLAEARKEYWEARTPGEDWARMMVDLPADPRWRRGFESMGQNRLLGRYHLARPYMAGPGTDPDSLTSFAQFLGDVGAQSPRISGGEGTTGYRANDLAALVARARLAGRSAIMPTSATPGLIDPISQAYYGTFGGGGQDAMNAQTAVAQMIARQRAGGGAFRGGLGDAIGRAMSAMAAARQARGAPEASFLDWYLKQRFGEE